MYGELDSRFNLRDALNLPRWSIVFPRLRLSMTADENGRPGQLSSFLGRTAVNISGSQYITAIVTFIEAPLSKALHLAATGCTTRLRTASPASPRMDAPGSGIYAEATKPEDVRVIVFGATGYIGRVVVSEFASQGYAVTAFARPRSGVGGKNTSEDVKRDLSPVAVIFGDVCDANSVRTAFELPARKGSTRARWWYPVSRSRSGGVADSQRIDYGATLNVLQAARAAGACHFVLLSAVCVQKPLLEFQRAKLRFEAALAAAAAEDTNFSYAIVRPTAFFKSLASQVERMKNGHLTSCSATAR